MTVLRPQLGPDRGSSGNAEPDASAIQPIPLSVGQQGLWLAQKFSPDVPISEAQYVEFHGDLDVDLLRKTATRAGHEFQSGYLRLVETDGEPYQFYDPSVKAAGPVIDVRGAPDPVAAGLEWMRREYTAPLDMTRDRLVATAIVQVGDRHYLLYCRSHHVAMDGYGAMMIVNRIAALYTAAVQGHTAEPNRAADIRALYEADRSYRESKRFTDDQTHWVNRTRRRRRGVSAWPPGTRPRVRTVLSQSPNCQRRRWGGSIICQSIGREPGRGGNRRIRLLPVPQDRQGRGACQHSCVGAHDCRAAAVRGAYSSMWHRFRSSSIRGTPSRRCRCGCSRIWWVCCGTSGAASPIFVPLSGSVADSGASRARW